MKRFIKYIITIVCCIGFILQSTCYAVDKTTTVPFVKKGSGYTEAVIVDNYDLGGDAGTSTVYNESEDVDLSAGAIEIAEHNDSITYHVDLKTRGSTTITLTFEGKVDADFSGATGGWMLLWTKAFTAVNTQYSISIQEPSLKYVRVGMTSDDGGADDLTIKMRAERHRK